MAVFEIPLQPRPQKFAIILNNSTYNLRTAFLDAPEGGWILDISDADEIPLVCGVPIVTGCDLLEQYAYLGLGGVMFATTDGELSKSPVWGELGRHSHLWFEPDGVSIVSATLQRSTTSNTTITRIVLQVPGGSSIVIDQNEIILTSAAVNFVEG